MKDFFDNLKESARNGDWGRFAALILLALALSYLFCVLVWAVLLLIDRNFDFLATFFGIPAAIVLGWRYYRRTHPIQVGGPLPPPSWDTYRAVMNTLRIAAQKVGPALGLAAIYEETDIRAEAAERILPNGNYWWMKFRLPKQNASVSLDENLVRRVLQREIQMVLETENPGAFDKVRYVRGGSYECIIQIEKAPDFDAYVYVYAVMASEEFFKQRGRMGNPGASLGSPGDDRDF